MPSLTAWWKFDNNNSLDSSGNGNTGTRTCYPTGCTNPTYGTGKIGTAISLDGSSQFVSVADSPSLDITDKITVAFWINASTTSPPADPRVIAKNYDWYVKLNAGKYPQFSAKGHNAELNNSIAANTWVHIAFTYDSTSSTPVAAYVNGSPAPFTNDFGQGQTLPSNPDGVNIRADSGGQSHFFPGEIDEVRIYNRVLSPAEIAVLYSSY
jgi:Concanavalin A-like lectin/glucanases superfamily